MKRHLLIDMGAARTRVVCVGDSRQWNEPSAVMTTAAEPPRILAVSVEADAAVERTPDNIRVRRPQMAGRIAEPDLVEKQLAFWLQKCLGRVFLPVVRPCLTQTVPCGAMDYERKALVDAGCAAHFKTVKLVDELVAHAAGMDGRVSFDEPMVVVAVGAAYVQAGVVRNGAVLTQRMIHAKNPRDGAVSEALNCPVRVADKPQLAVVNGVAQILPELDYLQKSR